MTPLLARASTSKQSKQGGETPAKQGRNLPGDNAMRSRWTGIRKRRKERRRHAGVKTRTTRLGKVVVVNNYRSALSAVQTADAGQGAQGDREAAAVLQVLFRPLVSLHEPAVPDDADHAGGVQSLEL